MRIIALVLMFLLSCTPPAHMMEYYYHDSGKHSPKRERIVRTAKRYIGAKYRYGGKSLFGFDCSGFVMHVFKKHRVNLPRSAKSQYVNGRKVDILNAKPGDLVFFNIDGKGISHVGIYLGNSRFIHAPSSGKEVSYASIENSYWKERFVGAASFLE